MKTGWLKIRPCSLSSSSLTTRRTSGTFSSEAGPLKMEQESRVSSKSYQLGLSTAMATHLLFPVCPPKSRLRLTRYNSNPPFASTRRRSIHDAWHPTSYGSFWKLSLTPPSGCQPLRSHGAQGEVGIGGTNLPADRSRSS